MTKKSVDEQLTLLHAELQTRENADPQHLPEDLRLLRHRIMYAHLHVEQSLQIILAYTIGSSIKGKRAAAEETFLTNAMPVFDHMEFYPKVKAAQALDLLPRHVVSLIMKVNDHRKFFAHPATYHHVIDAYKDKKKQLQTLNDLKEAMEHLDEYMKKHRIHSLK